MFGDSSDKSIFVSTLVLIVHILTATFPAVFTVRQENRRKAAASRFCRGRATMVSLEMVLVKATTHRLALPSLRHCQTQWKLLMMFQPADIVQCRCF